MPPLTEAELAELTLPTPAVPGQAAGTKPKRDPAVEKARFEWVQLTSDKLFNGGLGRAEADAEAHRLFAEKYGIEKVPTTIAEGIERAKIGPTPLTLEGLKPEDIPAERVRREFGAVGALAELTSKLPGVTASPESEAAFADVGPQDLVDFFMKRQQAVGDTVVDVEGKTAKAARMVGGALASIPMEAVSRALEFAPSPPEDAPEFTAGTAANLLRGPGPATRTLTELGLGPVPALQTVANMLRGKRPEQPLLEPAQLERNRVLEETGERSFYLDVLQRLEKFEGMIETYEAVARTQEVDEDSALYRAGWWGAFATDVLLPWEAMALAPVTKPTKALLRAGKAAKLAPKGAKAAAAVTAAKTAVGVDVIDITVPIMKRVDADLSAGKVPELPQQILDDMADLNRAPIEPVIRAAFREGSDAHRVKYRHLVDQAYKRRARKFLGSEDLVRVGPNLMLTPAEAARVGRTVMSGLERSGLHVADMAKRVEQGVIKLTDAEGMAVAQMMRKHLPLPEGRRPLSVSQVDEGTWRELVHKAAEEIAGDSAHVKFALRENTPFRDAMARGLKSIDTASGGIVGKLRADQFAYGGPRLDLADPRVRDIFQGLNRELEGIGPQLVRDLNRLKFMSSKSGPMTGVLSDASREWDLMPLLQNMVGNSFRVPSQQMWDISRKIDALPNVNGARPLAEMKTIREEIIALKPPMVGRYTSILNRTAPDDVWAHSMTVWAKQQRTDLGQFGKVVLNAHLPRGGFDPPTLDDSIAIYDAFLRGGDDFRDLLLEFGSPIADEGEALFQILAHYRALDVQQNAIYAAVDAGLALRGGYLTKPLRDEIAAKLAGRDRLVTKERTLPFNVVQEGGRDATAYHEWWERSVRLRTSRGDGGRAPKDMALRALEPGDQAQIGDALTRARRLLEADLQPRAFELLEKQWPGDVTGKKYDLYNHHTGKRVIGGMDLPHAMASLKRRRDLHDVIEVKGSGRPVAGWGQGGRSRKQAGTMTDDYFGPSTAERAVVKSSITPADQLSADEMTRFLDERGVVRDDVHFLTDKALHLEAAAYLEKFGFVVPGGRLTEVQTPDDIKAFLPDYVVKGIERAAGRAGLSRSAVWDPRPSSIPGLQIAKRVANTLFRYYKTLMIAPHVAYHTGNFMTAFGMMAMRIGPVASVRSMGNWARHGTLVWDLIKRGSKRGYKYENPGRAGQALVTRTGEIYSRDALWDIVKQGNVDTSQARVETAQSVARELQELNAKPMSVLKGEVFTGVPDMSGLPDEILDGLMEFAHVTDQVWRYPVLLDQLKQGAPPTSAARTARMALLDYGDLSNFERKYMRWALTFYSFVRKNIDNTVQAMWRRPSTVGGLTRLPKDQRSAFVDPAESLGELDYDAGRLILRASGPPKFGTGETDYRSSAVYWKTQAPTNYDVLTLFANATAAVFADSPEARREAVGELAGQTSPLIKVPIMLQTGKEPGTPFDIRSPRSNLIPNELVQFSIDNGSSLHDWLEIIQEPTDDPNVAVNPHDVAGMYYWRASGDGMARWQAIKQAPGQRILTQLIPQGARAVGISEPRPSVGRLGEILALGAPAKSIPAAPEVLRRARAEKEQEIIRSTEEVEGKRRRR